MTCAAYLDWGFKLKQDGLRDEDLTRLCAQVANFSLQQLHLLSRSASAHLQQAVYDRVEIDVVLVGHGRRRMITRWGACSTEPRVDMVPMGGLRK